MKKLLLVLSLIFTTVSLLATNYYVSATGSDAAAGTLAAPWQTIAKVNSATFVANDSILFKRGDSFFGSLIPNRSNLVFGAYGTGALPVITGFVTPTEWTLVSTGIYKTSIPTGTANMNSVAINGTTYPKGRTPNYPSLLSLSAASTTSATSASFTGVYTGGELVSVSTGGYVIVRNWITAQVGTTLTLSANNIPGGGNPPNTGASSFIQGALSCLDVFGEWCFNNTTKELFVFTGGTAPSGYTIQAATVDTLFNLGGANSRAVRSSVTATNINFQGSNYYGVFANGGTSNVVKNCTINGTGNGVAYANANSPLIDNNNIYNVGGNGVILFGTAGTSNITNNIIRKAGFYGGTGNNGFNLYTYNGINITGNNVNIDYNRVDSIGGYGIANYINSGIKVRYNYVSEFMNILNDGGGIYFWSYSNQTAYTGRQIIGNIVTKPRNVNAGNNKNVLMIYLDDATSDVDVLNNTCFGSTSGALNVPALYGNSNANLRIRGNTFYNVQYGVFLNKFAAEQITNNRIASNVMYPDITSAVPANIMFAAGNASGATMQASYRIAVNADSNYYRDQNAGGSFPHPFWGYGTGAGYGFQNVPDMNLATWKTYINGEANSVAIPTTTPDFQFNATKLPVTYSFPGFSKKDAQGNIYDNSVVIQPFTSKIFFANGNSSAGPLATTVTQTIVNCNGDSSTVVVSATGGTPPYTGIGTFKRAAGTYNFSVTDAVNTSILRTITITQPATALGSALTVTNVLCNGGNTGTITQLITGGTSPYTSNWGGGITTQNRTALLAGTYSVTTTDVRGCIVTPSPVTITQPAVLGGSVASGTITVNGGTTSITATATGGASGYTYNLNGGAYQSSNVFTGVVAGTYSVNIKDANNCIKNNSITITQPTATGGSGVGDPSMPSVVDNAFTFTTIARSAQTRTLRVFNSQGVVVHRRSVNLVSGANVITINTTGYLSGMYVANIKVNNVVQTFRFRVP